MDGDVASMPLGDVGDLLMIQGEII